MAVTDTYRLRINYKFFGADCSNVFFYLQNTGTGGAEELATQWELDVLPAVLDIMSTGVDMESIEVENLEDTGDFFNIVNTDSGDRSGEGLSNFYAWGFLYATTNRKIRSGGKRFSGVNETDVAAGEPTAAMDVILAATAATLEETVSEGGGANDYFPVLHTDGNVATGGAPLDVLLNSISFARLTTQNTRKTF